MPKGAGWDMTKTHSLQAGARWLLGQAGADALLVVVVRVDDLAIAADPKMKLQYVLDVLEDRMPKFGVYGGRLGHGYAGSGAIRLSKARMARARK